MMEIVFTSISVIVTLVLIGFAIDGTDKNNRFSPKKRFNAPYIELYRRIHVINKNDKDHSMEELYDMYDEIEKLIKDSERMFREGVITKDRLDGHKTIGIAMRTNLGGQIERLESDRVRRAIKERRANEEITMER
jgi:hypothetical protein